MTYLWDQFSLLLALQAGPQKVAVGDKMYLCRACTADGRLFATLPTDITVYELHLKPEHAAPLELDTARPIATTAWQVTATDLFGRSTQVKNLNTEIARTAIATHFSTGLATPETLAEELLAMVVECMPHEKDLAQQLALYRGDMPGSTRRLTACAAALALLAEWVEV